MKNTVKRLLAGLVVLMMVLPACISALAIEPNGQYSGTLEAKTAVSVNTDGIRNGKTFAAAETSAVDEIAADQVVTIMVELKSAPAMEVYDDYKDTNAYTQKLETEQATAIKTIETTLGIDVEVSHNYTLLFNGFSFDGEYRLVEQLNKIDGVRAFVSMEWNCPDIQLYNSADMVGAIAAWDLDYTGEGEIVAIIDTGLMCNHPAFSVNPENAHFTQEDIAAIIAEGNLQGTGAANMTAARVYYSAKVPFRWNYVTDTYQVAHTYNDHGTHVAGIAAGNGGEIVGIAKDAQIAAMQVFASTGGASWSDILPALEDCVVLGVGSANLSLGSACGFTAYYDASYAAVFENLVNAGVNLAMAAGNDYSAAYNNAWNNYQLAINPDYGTVGSPSTWPESLSVASVDNTMSLGYYIEYNDVMYSYTENTANAAILHTALGGQDIEFVAVPGYGDVDDYTGIDVNGKVALISRGDITFVEKGQNAQANGAVAAIIYNNTTGNINMATDASITIPYVFISQDAGQAMIAGEANTMFISDTQELVAVPGGGQPSSFSSWGTTSDLHIKPEIAAPGGNIYSATSPSFSGAYYQAWNGTSMACPHVAGGMLIVTEYVDDMFPNSSSAEKQVLVDSILMSTANPIVDSAGSYASVRKQGAGLMDLEGAVTTTAYLSVEGSVRPKLELGDDPEKTGEFVLAFTINNFGDTDLAYDIVPTVVLDDLVGLAYDLDGNLVVGFSQTSWDITEYCEFENGLTAYVPAGESVDVEINIAFSADMADYINYYYTSGAYFEGFVELYAAQGIMGDVNGDGNVDGTDALLVMRYVLKTSELESPALADVNHDGNVDMTDSLLLQRAALSLMTLAETELTGADLNIPFLGFYGDWNYSPMLDVGYYYDDFSLASQPYANTIGSSKGSTIFGLGINPYVETEDMSYYLEDRNAVSPNGDGFMETADTLYVGLMRNAQYMAYELYDADTGELLNTFTDAEEVRKGFYYDSLEAYYQCGVNQLIMPSWNAAQYEGRNLIIRVVAELSNDGSVTTNPYTNEANAHGEWLIPIYVDVTAPVVSDVVAGEGTITFNITDDHYVAYAGSWNAGGTAEEVYMETCIEETGVFEDERAAVTSITLAVEEGCYICVADYAGNEGVYYWDGTTLTAVEGGWSSYTGSGFSLPDVQYYGYGTNLTNQAWLRVAISEVATNNLYYAGGTSTDSHNYKAGCYTGTYVYGIDGNNNLYRYDATVISSWGSIQSLGNIGTTDYSVTEMCYDRTTDTLYIVTGAGNLYSLDPATLTTTLVCQAQYGIIAIDFDLDGTCYIVDAYGYLGRLDITTGTAVDIADLGVVPVNNAGQFYIQSGCVRNGYFYWDSLPASATMYADSSVIVAKCSSGEYQSLGACGGGILLAGTFVWEYELPAASVDTVDWYENFEGAVDWSTLDADGDGNNWVLEYQTSGQYYDGSKTIVSYSWNQEILYPDNWIISPDFSIANDGNNKYLSFWVSSRNTGAGADIAEHYQVLIAPAGSTNTSAFTVIYETTMDTADLTEHVINVTAYAGQDVMIAFRHFDCFDQYTLIIDAVGVGNWIGSGEGPTSAAGSACDVSIAIGYTPVVAVVPAVEKQGRVQGELAD